MREVILTKDLLQEEALSILRSVRDNAAQGRSNRLGDVKESLEAKVTLEFDDYFLFLRKFNFMLLDRELGALTLTPEGERLLGGGSAEGIEGSIEQFFASRLGDEIVREETEAAADLPRRPPPPPPPSELVAEPSRRPPPPPLVAPALSRPEPPRPPVTGSPASERAVGAELDLRYVKYESLGGGALAVVYRGKQTGLGIDVAIKEMRDIFAYFSFLQRGEVVKKLKKEICAQAQLRHPGVVGILDQNAEVSRPYYVQELMSGSLRQKIEAAGGKGLPVPEALRAFLQIAYALRAAHAVGLLHQNIKPENVLFDSLGNARLSDFGLSRVIDNDVTQRQLPQVFVGLGGMAYLPPELLSPKKEFGPEGDIYMLGLLLYEMLTGQLPGRRSPLPSSANAEVPAKIDPIFDRMAQDRRDARYPDVDALLDDFYSAFSDGRFLHKGDLVLHAGAPAASPSAPVAVEGAKPEDKAEKRDEKKEKTRAGKAP